MVRCGSASTSFDGRALVAGGVDRPHHEVTAARVLAGPSTVNVVPGTGSSFTLT